MPPAAHLALVLALVAAEPTAPSPATAASGPAPVAAAGPARDITAWEAAFRKAVHAAWTPPVSCRAGHVAAVALRVVYRRDGGVPPVTTVRQRGVPMLEEAARQALESVVSRHEPPPIPDGEDSIAITYSFYCNMSDDAQRRWGRGVEKRTAALKEAETRELGSRP